jgi:hypothetical protein
MCIFGLKNLNDLSVLLVGRHLTRPRHSELSIMLWRCLGEWMYRSIMEMVNFTAWQLDPEGTSPRCPLIKGLGRPHKQSGCCGLKETGNRITAVQPAALSCTT